jgi:hypothetical protein
VGVAHHEAHTPVDLTYAAIFLTTRLAPDPRSPWAPPRDTAANRRRHDFAWSKAFPALAKVAYGADVQIAKLLRALDHGNAYRIVARKEST